MPDIAETVGRKIGPLPAWGWGIAIGGTILAVRFLRGGRQSSAEPVLIPTGAPPVDPSQGFIEQLANTIAKLQEQVATLTEKITPTAPPAIDRQAIPPIPFGQPQPISAKPPLPWPLNDQKALAVIASWPAYARASLETAREYATRIIRNYSPGGAFYRQGQPIPYIPTGILSASEQAALAKQYGGTLRL